MLGLIDMTAITTIWGHSSAGRAPAWHAGGQEFESPWLHWTFTKWDTLSRAKARAKLFWHLRFALTPERGGLGDS